MIDEDIARRLKLFTLHHVSSIGMYVDTDRYTLRLQPREGKCATEDNVEHDLSTLSRLFSCKNPLRKAMNENREDEILIVDYPRLVRDSNGGTYTHDTTTLSSDFYKVLKEVLQKKASNFLTNKVVIKPAAEVYEEIKAKYSGLPGSPFHTAIHDPVVIMLIEEALRIAVDSARIE